MPALSPVSLRGAVRSTCLRGPVSSNRVARQRLPVFAALAQRPTLPPVAPPGDQWKKVLKALDSGALLEGKIQSVKKGGVVVVLEDGLKGFIPMTQLGATRVKPGFKGDLSYLVGQPIQTKVVRVEEAVPGKESIQIQIILSERRVTEGEVMQLLAVGQVVTGIVSNIVDYGAFMELDSLAGGPANGTRLSGLVPKLEVSWDAVPTVESVLSVGQKVSAKVIEVDLAKNRVTLSIRQTMVDPLKQTKEQLEWSNDPATVVGVPEILDLIRQLRRQQGVDGVTSTRQAMAIHVASQELELYLTRGGDTTASMSSADEPVGANQGYLVMARLGVHYQELRLQTSLGREEVKQVLQRAVAAVARQP